MSKFRVQQPVTHIPSFKEYKIDANTLVKKYYDLGIEIPFPVSSYWFFHTDIEGWAKILPDLVLKSNLYKKDRTDCEWYALKAYITCRERYGLNTLPYTYGIMPLGAHGFNSFWTGDIVMLLEPNEGFKDRQGNVQDLWGVLDGGLVFEIGDNGYQPKAVLL